MSVGGCGVVSVNDKPVLMSPRQHKATVACPAKLFSSLRLVTLCSTIAGATRRGRWSEDYYGVTGGF
ncbi:hypothetical protein Pmani_015824 [Petrolisthes manimaculis]|uniref:Uncharacterized protein n=1 Tax=Petrolisthes manimaculis TaxID=1843537 RepID=A0AAE1U728_9EUCA|nr:hypothetical protein Pmani_015824 [Petrolisthes manimaculis]